jgi:hydrogenase/urease accessory protein HupE
LRPSLARRRRTLFVLPAAWFVGSIARRLFDPSGMLTAVAAILTIATGSLAAADRPMPQSLIAALTVVLGLWNGGSNGVELARAHASALPAVGVACAIFVVAALLAGNITLLRATWSRIVARFAGSWIAASGPFMLGCSVRGR